MEQHSHTIVHTIGPGTVITANMVVRDTQVGPRDEAGGNDTIQLGRSFAEECNIGDECKYVNLFIQVGPRTIADASVGWLEWAFCCHKQDDPLPTNTNLGTNTLGDVCTKYLRNDCIYTGNIPVGRAQANSQNIVIKIPKTKIYLKVGDVWRLYLHHRTTSATETGTQNVRVITSFMYKNYH